MIDDDYFNIIYDKIITTYNNGECSNGRDFLRYLESEMDIDAVLTNVRENTLNLHNLRSPLVYNQKYFAEIFYNSIVDAVDNGLISNSDDFIDYITNREDISNYYVMTLAVISDSIEDVYYDMSDVYRSNKLDYALGSDLDSIGDIIGCPRPQATKSSVLVTFYTNTIVDESIPIRTGTIVSDGKGVSFVTVEDGVIPIGSDSVDVCCLSIDTGTNTRVLSNSIKKIDSVLEYEGVNVINNNGSSGGRNVYTDDEYRELLSNWVRSKIRGSKEAFDEYFSDFDGLDGYKLIPKWDGSGTLKVVLDPGYPYQLQKAYSDIMNGVVQIDDDVTMFAPVKVDLSVYCRCNVDIDQVNRFSKTEKEEIRSRIVDAIKVYVNGDVLNSSGLGIGEDFIPFQLGVYISSMVPEVKNITFVKSSMVNRGSSSLVDGSGEEYKVTSSGLVDSKGNVCVWVSEPVSIGDDEIAFVSDDNIFVEME